jgi:hypothetical protein
MSRIFAFLVVTIFASQSFAQIIYEPVQFQHGTDVKYFYGGSDPATHRWANHELRERAYSRGSYGVFSGMDHSAAREMFNHRDPVYTDDIPLTEASRFGYTENDARNEAAANMPLYFRKRELLAAAQRDVDGSLVVPADVKIDRAYLRREVDQPTSMPARGTILIIPKRLLDKPVMQPKVALAR